MLMIIELNEIVNQTPINKKKRRFFSSPMLFFSFSKWLIGQPNKGNIERI